MEIFLFEADVLFFFPSALVIRSDTNQTWCVCETPRVHDVAVKQYA